jgi:hypothetical protein
MDSLVVVGGIVVIIIALVVLGTVLKGAGIRAAMKHGATVHERLAAGADQQRAQLQTALRFADPLAGRAVVGRAVGGIKWVRADGDQAWQIGDPNALGHLAADWNVVGGVGMLAATRTVAMNGPFPGGDADQFPGAENWNRMLERVTTLAQTEGIAFERFSVEFARTQPQPSGNIWTRA